MQIEPGKSLYEDRRPSNANLILSVIIFIFLVILAAEVIFNTYYLNIYVKGKSMVPTLQGAPSSTYSQTVVRGGDYVFVNKRAVPGYSDIVVVTTKNYQGIEYDIIKRAVAFGGDTVKIERGQLYVKYRGESLFTPVSEDYLSEDYCTPSDPVNTYPGNGAEHVVAENCMFLLGDNRDNSEDSRSRGDFPMSDLVGVVPQWALDAKAFITGFYTFFDFDLGFAKLKNNGFGV